MRFSTRLLIIVVVVVMAFGAVSVLSLSVVAGVQQLSDFALDMQKLSSTSWHLQSLTYELQVTRNLHTTIPEWLEERDSLVAEIQAATARAESINLGRQSTELADAVVNLSDLSELITSELEDYAETLAELTNNFTDYPLTTLVETRAAGRNLAAMRAASGATIVATYLDDTLQSLIDRIISTLDEVQNRSSGLILGFFFGVVGVATAVVVALILLFVRKLRKQFSEIGASMKRLADGDLSVRLATEGKHEVSELSRHIQNYVDEFARVVVNIQDISQAASSLRSDLMAGSEESAASVTQIGGNIDAISRTIGDLDATIEETRRKLEQINQGMQDLEKQIERQSHTVEQSSSAVEEMTASVTSVSKIAEERRQAAERLKAVTSEGHTNVASTDENVQAIADSVEEILGIITVINKIAGQTSILSMNAAIEAAHAGDYGRGFSVVAEEIRRLSEDTNANARKIKDQLRQVAELVNKTQQRSETTRESFASIEEEVGSTSSALEEISATMRELAEGTASVLESTAEAGKVTSEIRGDATTAVARTTEITQDMAHVRDISATVRGGIEEIGVGTREINRMVQNLSDVTQAMTDQIDKLNVSVSRFQTNDAAGTDPTGRQAHTTTAEAETPGETPGADKRVGGGTESEVGSTEAR